VSGVLLNFAIEGGDRVTVRDVASLNDSAIVVSHQSVAFSVETAMSATWQAS
jgi:hypothetical protein